MKHLRRIAIGEKLCASPAVRAGLAWFTERFARHTGGALTPDQFPAFEAHVIDYASAQFAGVELISDNFDLSNHTMQVAIRVGMLDNMVRHAAAQLNLEWPDGLDDGIDLIVDIKATEVKGRYNDERVVVWSAA